MIGIRYWSTGITLVPDTWPEPQQWTARLDFKDSGFCQADATEGSLRLRYFVDDIEVGLKTLVQDADRLGIEWNNAVGGPTVYVERDGELESGDEPALRAAANRAALLLGWNPCYSDESAAAVREP